MRKQQDRSALTASAEPAIGTASVDHLEASAGYLNDILQNAVRAVRAVSGRFDGLDAKFFGSLRSALIANGAPEYLIEEVAACVVINVVNTDMDDQERQACFDLIANELLCAPFEVHILKSRQKVCVKFSTHHLH